MTFAERDAIIVGAGPAGAICAAYMAKAGADVLLLEKDSFPRHKACGDIQREGIVTHLERLGAVRALDSASTCIRRIQLISGGGFQTVMPFECYCVSRYELDRLLAETAKRHGAELRENCMVTDVIMNMGQACGVKIRYRGEDAEIRGKLIIGADGSCSSVAGALGIRKEESYSIWMGERAYFRGVKLDRSLARDRYDAYGVFSFDESAAPGFFWILPVGENGVSSGICNAGVILQGRDQYRGTDLQERFFRWINGSEIISDMFSKAERISRWAGGRMNDIGQSAKKAGNGFLMIGDAASLVMPFSFDGLSQAADSAYAAAAAAMAVISENDFSEENLTSKYERALGSKSRTETDDEIREMRLFMESVHDPKIMDRVIENMEKDPVYRKKHITNIK